MSKFYYYGVYSVVYIIRPIPRVKDVDLGLAYLSHVNPRVLHYNSVKSAWLSMGSVSSQARSCHLEATILIYQGSC